jgi:hypothetical protein
MRCSLQLSQPHFSGGKSHATIGHVREPGSNIWRVEGLLPNNDTQSNAQSWARDNRNRPLGFEWLRCKNKATKLGVQKEHPFESIFFMLN